ncbi:LLM class flavin-dependent oxidoreductase [Actinotalea fermentans]|uniref:N5,N10-methylene tetrahydromethanopterin reductase n=1 Tax=Actinotalea fermentans TaxID=43671 RepID=A0A511YY93_9CELL|nr:LLM class flavin-dependent oxidoreductase [Actinotalea fermentans]KGM15524.1 5,10-methylene tetrahydromethanopterin reductase [Actinotalea fermentans ATCC 43279 = JCM 9966 = DSM 3133]GEN80171.1 N5,N10-methylene tetrahydromethanopterin reductase [Actinotalea fermentans]
MTDYGHDMLFGTFITPLAADPGRTVDLAVATERAGLDLATFQDHPYQPRFLDAWTLMTWVAARTERLRVVANVANLPLRHPVVLARSVASLDLLSGGRAELGLGAGAFWDAIAAVGGPRLAPGEAVQALEEALEVVRGVWDAGNRERFAVPGRFHAVDGAKRGPAPAHDVAIWVGAVRPRMLRLIGRAGDGWLPSLGYLGGLRPLAEGNAVIDDAAAEAGRSPSDVRRLLNLDGELTAARTDRFLVGPPEQWAEQLADLALGYGVSAFVLPGDDPDAYEVFGREVAPAVRELVAAERAR